MVNDRSGGSERFSVKDQQKLNEGTGGSSQFMVNDRSMGSDAFNLPG